MVSYSAAKSGIYGFTKSLAKELGPYGITVNCISPAAVATPRLLAMPERMEMAKKDIWLRRLGEPEEMANAVTFLVSDEASFITGHNLAVDGGRSLGW
jgi:NAD(P)-dependent dehydrogenase (short-subunit alcohol dehydrogenase family)